MRIIIRQLELPLDYKQEQILAAIISRLGCSPEDVLEFSLLKRSLDARPRRKAPVFVVQAEASIKKEFGRQLKKIKDVEILPDLAAKDIEPPVINTPIFRPVVVGAGPAGLMAAYHLAAVGLKPLLIDRGCSALERKTAVDDFWRTGKFDSENNALYGEGGAGLFSDGKLTARSKDKPRMRLFFSTLVEAGADPDILIDSEPHIGSDKLLEIIPGIREKIIQYGGEIKFETRLEKIITHDGQVQAIIINGNEFKTRHLLLATGHSARDVYQLLAENEVELLVKSFAIGVRLEMPQAQINKGQYGDFAGHPQLKPASFKVTRKAEKDCRACYSFCMCPGGVVISCASQEGMLTTNGMSYSTRDGFWGNAAFLVPVGPEDYAATSKEDMHPQLAGLAFQQQIEKAAFVEGGSNYSLPATRLADFFADKVSETLPENRSCKRAVSADFRKILPDYVIDTLKNSIKPMLNEINSYELCDGALLYAAETRSSSPLRILRDESGQSISHKGLFPAGEGSGYAGGIVSSAIDGIKAAEMLIKSLG